MKTIFFSFLFFGSLISAQNSFSTQAQLPSINLWTKIPDGPGPGGESIVSAKGSITHITTPKLIIHQPQNPNGIAILVISGGGYAHIESGSEGYPASEWLKSLGITAFELQ
ncbi:hypothetical protein BOQ62_11065 [Chryseobacterium sp. CH21]|uniref:hypothetical protein n=1 Tax=Chryseobacterium sp. CH21 TaxID=713556 RepID=UPI00100AE88B|nr:hypothetical protein [Chryseobacterium sp. CH21]RXM39696.1 hypothetical protein BOQ62_11065 [Chryseobacterium sp. CH21]